MFNNMVFKDVQGVKIYHIFASKQTLRRFFIQQLDIQIKSTDVKYYV